MAPISPQPAVLPAPRPASENATPLDSWIKSFNSYLVGKDSTKPSELFLADSYWRDHLGLSWELRTLHPLPAIEEALADTPLASFAPSGADFTRPVDAAGEVNAIWGFITFNTKHGAGRGVVKLLEDLDDGKKWKAFNVYTLLTELEGCPERIGPNRPRGWDGGTVIGRTSWQERREKERREAEPYVVIIGAGQAGLATAARLKALDVPTLIIERNERVGDNWRKRYQPLVLHDPVYYDHLPYLPYPPNWPVFTPKDKLADWLETYVAVMELNVWTSSTITNTLYDTSTGSWKLTVSGPFGARELTPRHVVLATGHSGDPYIPGYPGMSDFDGTRNCHSSAFPGADTHGNGRKAVVVGTGNSGHDIAQDYFEHGWDVTIVQRSSTNVVGSKNALEVLFAGLYDETGPSTEDADLIFNSIPLVIMKRLHISAAEEIARRDEDLLKKLAAAGFKLDNGPNEAGFFFKYLETGGGYYIDVGCSKHVAAGEIRLKAGVEISHVTPKGLAFSDGTELEANEIVWATGYGSMVDNAKAILGEDVMQGVEGMWGIEKDTMELWNVWQEVKKGLWIVGGNLAISRWGSRLVGLGIAARKKGLVE